jgi:hypothetical protein
MVQSAQNDVDRGELNHYPQVPTRRAACLHPFTGVATISASLPPRLEHGVEDILLSRLSP